MALVFLTLYKSRMDIGNSIYTNNGNGQSERVVERCHIIIINTGHSLKTLTKMLYTISTSECEKNGNGQFERVVDNNNYYAKKNNTGHSSKKFNSIHNFN